MIKNSVIQEIENWKKDNNIKSKKKTYPLLESYRRIHQFNNGRTDIELLLLAFPSEIKPVKDCFKCTSSGGKETPKNLNWYKLTDKGKNIISDLMNRINWNEKDLNQWIFDL